MLYFNINSYPFINQIYQQALHGFITKGYNPNYCMIHKGKKILQCIDEINSYQTHYYVHHTAKLDQAYDQLNLNDLMKSGIQIYDWGCGQGLATLVFLEKLGIKLLETKIKSICYIDPSLVSLNIGRSYLSSYLSIKGYEMPKIQLLNRAFDELNGNEFENIANSMQIHILSNIIDVNTYSMSKLTESISKSTYVKGIVIIVSPNYSSTQRRIREFEYHLMQNMNVSILSNTQYQIYADVFHVKSKSNKIVPVKNMIKIFEIKRGND